MMENKNIPNRPVPSQRVEPAAGGGANPTQAIRQRRVNRWRLGWFLAALALLVIGTVWFCWLQPPAPVALTPQNFSLSKWLWQPHERNAAKRLTTVPDSDLRGVYMTNDLGWVVGDGGVILHTHDGGHSWQLQTNIAWPKVAAPATQSKSSDLSNGDFSPNQMPPSAQKGYSPNRAEAPEQNIANQKNPAPKGDWLLPGVPKLPDRLRPPWEMAGNEAVADAGKSLFAVSFVDAKIGWAIGVNNLVLHTTNGGEAWSGLAAGDNSWKQYFPKRSVANDAERQFSEVSEALLPADSGVTWPTTGAATNLRALSVACIGTRTVCVVGRHGLILRTDDQGKSWVYQTANSDASLKPEAIYSRRPAAMFYGVLLLSLVFLRIGLIKQSEPEKFKPSIADYAVSDRPLTSKDFDALNFGPLAQGLANFLRNKSTTGPLTLAVAGPWGSGKSSIMGLLREKLERQGIRPVWFNAWHHQDEKQLLAALLENIRSQAVPPWYSWRGASFRMKLINRRMHREWPMLFLGALFLASFAALLNWLIQGGLSWDVVQAMVSKPDLFSAGKLAVLATALVTGWKILQGFQAFGLNPAKLLASVTEKAKLSDLGEQTSFRHRFAQEFEDVTAALQPRTMTVFIDDLDRCEPDQVMSVMQSLNFLSSSGECFLIIGMEENAVTNCVAISLKEQFDSQQGEKLDEKASVKRRWDYARLWMEKLIQIRIPVPDPSDEQFRALLTGKSSRGPAAAPRRNLVVEWASRCWTASVPALPWAGLIAVVLAGFFLTGFELDHWPWLKARLAPKTELPPAAWVSNSLVQPQGLLTVQLAVPDGVPGAVLMTNVNFAEWFARQKWNVNLEFAPNVATNPAPSAGLADGMVPDLAAATYPDAGRLTNSKPLALTLSAGQQSHGGWWLALPFLIVVLVYGWKKIAEILEQRYGDSDDFRSALRRWADVIQADAGTPRAAKRLINKLRFYAMMSRALKAANVADINESVVVAFGVNEHRLSRSGTIEAGEKLDRWLRIERNLNPDDALKGRNADLQDLKTAWQNHPEIFRYLSSTVKTEAGAAPKAA